MADFAVFAEGLSELEELGDLKREIRVAAFRAINKTSRDSRVKAARRIRDQINFPASYVSPSQKRLYVSKQAQGNDLEGRITARGRATSLARFVQGSPRVGQAGVTLSVQPGKSRRSKRMFLVKLPQGQSDVDTKFNLGLAIRLKKGETLKNKTRARRLASGLYLLYGPSVDQVFRSGDGTGVANDMVPEIERDLSNEFLRLLDL